MAFLSNLFKGDKKLEAAQVKDAAHLTPGTTGEHVARVQMALFALDSLVIDPDELRAQTYGPSTARAVLAYKTKRQIINRAYQNKPDNIVGKMTITRLDQDMLLFEQSHRGIGDCRFSPSGGLDIAAPAATRGLVPTPAQLRSVAGNRVGESKAKPQLGRVLRIFCAITKRSAVEDGFPISRHLRKAKDLLFEFGMTLSVEFKDGFADTIDFPHTLVLDEDVALLRQAAENTRPGFANVLRVIVCQRSVSAHPGETFRNIAVGPKVFRPFAVLNSKTPTDDSTLIHEMIHAAHSGPVPHDREKFSVFFEFAPSLGELDRNVLKEDRAITLSKSFFARA